jgi:DNA-binding NarL/FixJ family response regulator
MEKRRVILFSTQRLLSESLEYILRHDPEVELDGPFALDNRAFASFPDCCPDVVLIADENRPSGDAATLTAQILDRYPDLPIVTVTLGQDVVRIYSSRTLPARSADLIDIIRHLPLPGSPATG